MIWFVLVALLATLAAGALYMAATAAAPPRAKARFDHALRTEEEAGPFQQGRFHRASLLTRLRALLGRLPASDVEEIELHLRRAGWVHTGQRIAAYTTLALAPLALCVVGLVVALAVGGKPFVFGFLGFGLGFVGPRYYLRWRAADRQRAIRDEMSTVLHLMRMLFDAGLSLEHCLKVIGDQGRDIAPNLAAEFDGALQRIYHGQERGDALEEMAQPLGVIELSEAVAILKQVTRYGGSLRESLIKYSHLIEDRRLTSMREEVGKLSGKMTIVMVAFMFPALMIFLAGPGFVALARALVRM